MGGWDPSISGRGGKEAGTVTEQIPHVSYWISCSVSHLAKATSVLQSRSCHYHFTYGRLRLRVVKWLVEGHPIYK